MILFTLYPETWQNSFYYLLNKINVLFYSNCWFSDSYRFSKYIDVTSINRERLTSSFQIVRNLFLPSLLCLCHTMLDRNGEGKTLHLFSVLEVAFGLDQWNVMLAVDFLEVPFIRWRKVTFCSYFSEFLPWIVIKFCHNFSCSDW